MNLLDHEQILTYEMNFMGLHGASLSNYETSEENQVFFQPSQASLNKANQVSVTDVYSIREDTNSNIKAFSVALLRMIFENKKNNHLCDHIKCHLYNNQTILTSIINRPYNNLGSQIIKKIFVEMFQMLKYGSYKNKTYIKLTKYPIILSLFTIYLRVILKNLNITNAGDYQKKVPTQQAYETLIQFFDLDCVSQERIYYFQEDQVILSTHDNKEFLVGNYTRKSYLENSLKDTWKANQFAEDQKSQDSDEDFVYNKQQKESQIITPQFQNIIQTENNFQRRKSSFYNKETPLKQLGKKQDEKQQKRNVFTDMEMGKNSFIDRVQLWNQPHIESEGEDDKQPTEIKDNPEAVAKLKLALSIESLNALEDQQILEVITNPKLFYIDSPKPKPNNQFLTNLKGESKNPVTQNIKRQQKQEVLYYSRPLTNTKHQQTANKDNQNNILKVPIKKWYPFKKMTKTQSLREEIMDDMNKNPMDSDIFNTQVNSSNDDSKIKPQKNSINSQIISISYAPPLPSFRKPPSPIVEPWKRTEQQQQRTSMIIMKQPSVCINPQPDHERKSSRLITENSARVLTARTISKSPIDYQREYHCVNNTSRIQYKPQIKAQYKPKVSFIYGQAPITHQTRPAIKSQYQPYINK